MRSEKAVVLGLLLVLLAEILVPAINESYSQAVPSLSALNPMMSNISSDETRAVSLGLLQSGTVDVSIALDVRNISQLQDFINSRQRSTNVKAALSEEQFEANYSPAQSDYDRVAAFLSANNLSVTQTWPNRLLVTAKGSVANVQRAFHTQIGLFSLKGTTFYNSTGNIQVPPVLSSCGIADINVNNLAMQSTLSRASGLAPEAVAYKSSPNDFRDAYGTTSEIFPTLNGAGTTIAIVDAYGDPTIASDVDLFNSYFGLPSLNLTVEGTGGTNSNWTVETALDVEWAHAMAPEAAIILQLVPNAFTSSLFGAVNTLVSLSDPPDVISLSWGGSETSSYRNIFAAAAAKGINIYVSTGDNGAYNGGSSLAIIYPASDPNVIAVGGTTLNYNTVQGTHEYYEYGWSGSGGGYSKIFSEPSYQTDAGIPNPTAKRAIPDVSLNADPSSGVTIYVGGRQQSGWGGTSLSAPLMAGIAADALNGNLSLNNNVLYGLYNSTSQYNVSFHDIYLDGNNGYYAVQSGWDAVTGLGSINLQNFANSKPSGISLTNQTQSSTSIKSGQTFRMNYTIDNPKANSTLTQIGVGAAIRLDGGATEINDTSNDIYINLPGGQSNQSRQFATSPSLTSGTYDVKWELWMGPPGMGNLLSSSGWQMNQIQVTSSGPTPAPSPSQTPTPTPSPSVIPTPSPIPPPSPSPTPSLSPSPTSSPTSTPTPTPSLTPSPSPPLTPAPSPTPSLTPSPSPSPSSTLSPSPSPIPSPSPTPFSTATPAPTSTATPTPTPAPTDFPSPTFFPSPSPASTPNSLPTPTSTPSLSPRATPFNSLTQNSTATPTTKPKSTPTPTLFPTTSPKSTVVQAMTSDGAKIELSLGGNITSTQITDVTISIEQSSAKTILSFTVTGQSGNTGEGNITIPKSLATYGTAPLIYIDNQLCQNQGYTEDTANYYIWYTTHFSTHEVSIVFLGKVHQEFPVLPMAAAVVVVATVGMVVVLSFRNLEKTRWQRSRRQ